MKSKKNLIIIALIAVISLFGVTYAYFNYYGIGGNQKVVAGKLKLTLNDGTDTINLSNIFPETVSEARSRDDNFVTFTVSGVNTTTNEDVYYEILLNEGDEEEGRTRLNPKDLLFDLIEIEGDTETYLIDAVSFNDIDARRIWVNAITQGTSQETSKTYKLRMWLSEDVIISNTDPNASYSTSVFETSYVSVKVSISGDLQPKDVPLIIDSQDTYVENNNAYFYATLSNNTTEQLTRSVTKDKISLDVTGTNTDIVFSYKDSKGNVVEETSESLNLSYDLAPNESVEIQIFVIPKNDANGETKVNLKASKNDIEIQNFFKKMNIYGTNFCLNNGLNKLYDCILASDSLETNVETAKVNIANKGEANLNDTAPIYTYVEEETLDVENVYEYDGNKFYFGDSYIFNETTGKFDIYNADGTDIIADYLSDNYKNYYTCGPLGVSHKNCINIYRVKSTSVSGTTYTITLGDKITSKVSSSIKSEVGLYKTEDDYGDSYFYRGDVTNNNVAFGGYYWKIIRTNGDGSIRLIYNGNVSNATSWYTIINYKDFTYGITYPLENSPIGIRITDPTYVGYMYGKNFVLRTSDETRHSNFKATTNYYFADGYEFDEENEVFRLKKVNLDPVAKTTNEIDTVDEITGKKLYELYPYTCKSISIDDACEFILKVNGIVSETSANVQYISYSSADKDSTRTNQYSSNAKTVVENWYATNIINKKDDNDNFITDYIVDGTFCNDRSTPHETYSSGYLLNTDTYYGSYYRISFSADKQIDLKCSNDIRDTFSDTSDKGNGLLSYPIALITVDEVVLAGGKYNAKNENFYLNSNYSLWTMSPATYDYAYGYSSIYHVSDNGSLYSWSHAGYSFGLRPVINIRGDVLISQGDGTNEKPFILSLS